LLLLKQEQEQEQEEEGELDKEQLLFPDKESKLKEGGGVIIVHDLFLLIVVIAFAINFFLRGLFS
jgi:hypothetical protein